MPQGYLMSQAMSKVKYELNQQLHHGQEGLLFLALDQQEVDILLMDGILHQVEVEPVIHQVIA